MNDKSILVRLRERGLPTPDVALTGSAAARANTAARRYEVVGELAQGSVGIVQRGHDNDLGRDVALKVLRAERLTDAESVRHFVEEAQIGGQLEHPGIVPIYELGLLDDARPYFAMKLLKGESLAHRLARRADPVQDLREFVGVFRDVCRTMSYAHARGVVHRDLEPGNIVIGDFGEVQVVDWGRARVLSRDGTDGVDERSDLFGLGAILCRILTGVQCAHDAETLDTPAARASLDEARAALAASGADPSLVDLCRRCLDPRPEHRPPSAEAAAETAAAWLADVESRAHRAQIQQVGAEADAEEQRRTRRQTKLVAGGVVAIVLIAVALLLAVNLGRLGRERERRAAIDTALEDATRLRAAGAWPEALAAARRAIELGADDAVATTIEDEARVATARARTLAEDDAFLAELEEIRGRRGQAVIGADGRLTEVQDDAGTDAAYAAAFERRFGSLEAGAARLTASRHAAAFAANLDVWCWVRKTQLRSGDWQAIDHMARRIDPANEDVRDALLADDPAALLAIAEQRGDDLPLALAARIGMSLTYQRGQSGAAFTFLRRQHDRAPSDFWINMRLSEAAARLGRFEVAARFAMAAVAVRPTQTIALRNLATALSNGGDPAGAIVALRRVTELDPDSEWAYTNLGAELSNSGDSRAAVPVLRRAVELAADDALPVTNLGSALSNAGEIDEAIAAFRRALELDPESVHALKNLGITLRNKGDLAGAIATFRRAIELDATNASLQGLLGESLQRADDRDGAVAAYRRAVELDPTDADHLTALAVLLWTTDQAAAIAAYRRAAECGSDAGRYSTLGDALGQVGDEDGAIAAYRRAAELAPEEPGRQTMLGGALSNAGRLDDAQDALRRALALDPGFVMAHQFLGITLERAGDLDGAVAEYRRTARLDARYAAWAEQRITEVRLLPAMERLLRGERVDVDTAERVTLAAMLYERQYNERSAAAYAEAFAADERIAGVGEWTRYNAACAAALAGGAWRARAVEWLRVDLQRLRERLTGDPAAVERTLRHWQSDPDLASIRDGTDLDADAARLWTDVAAVLADAAARRR